MRSINKTIPQTTDLRVRDIGLSGIAITIQRRALNLGVVDSLVSSMKEVGLINPITIRPREGGMGYYLVAGRHRLEGAKKLKWESIPCIVLEGITADEAELREIDENLIRANLSPAEEAAHHERRQALHEKRHPETKRGGDRKSAKSKRQNVDSKGYAADTANKIGKTRKTVERAVRRGKKIPDVASLAGTSLDKGAELDALAKMSPEQQSELIKKASAGEKVSARELKKDRKHPGHKTERHPPAPVVPEQTAEDRKAFYRAEEEPDIPIFPDACTAIGAPALPPSVSAPPVARPADALPPPAATSLPPEPGERSSRKQSDPAFDLLCGASGEMNFRRMVSNLGARAVWQSMVAAFGIPAIYRVMTEEQKNEFSDLINAEVEAQNA
jgi:ParB family transcriptional regulator, chromosome partitioning protein